MQILLTRDTRIILVVDGDFAFHISILRIITTLTMQTVSLHVSWNRLKFEYYFDTRIGRQGVSSNQLIEK